MFEPLLFDTSNDVEIEFFLDESRDYTERFAMILLFEKYTSDLAKTFFEKYGEDMQNILGNDYALFTIYPKNVIDKWKSDYTGKRKIEKQNFEPFELSAKHIIFNNRMSQYFKVKNYPCLIFIDLKGSTDGKVKYENYYFEKKSAVGIKDKIREITYMARESKGNYETIVKKCLNNDIHALKEKIYTDDTYFARHIFDKYKSTKYNKISLISEGIGLQYEKYFYRRLNHEIKKGFDRDQIIAICIMLGDDSMTIDDCMQSEKKMAFPGNEREKKIAEWVDAGYNLDEIEQLLIDNDFIPLVDKVVYE